MTIPTNNLTEKKSEVAESIIDAAERLMNSYGYQKMTMTDLAAEAGIGVGTTYLHFSSKADVAVAVIERVQNRMFAELIEISAKQPFPEPRLRALLFQFVFGPYRFVQNKLSNISLQQMRRHGSEFMADVTSSDPSRMEEWKTRLTILIGDIISSGIEAGVFLSVDPIETGRTLLTAISGFLPKHLDQEDFNNTDMFERQVNGVINLLINGILYERNTDGTNH